MAQRISVEEALSARYWVLFIAAMSGLMMGSAGVAIFPGIAQLAAPIVCSGGDLVTKTSSYTSGRRSGTQTSASCVDANGKRSSVSAGLTMLVITFELFVPFLGLGWGVCSQLWPMPKAEVDEPVPKLEADD
jgi:hypothetical protein